MARRFRRRGNTSEEGAGWIYADLFLALMVVGLGSAVITASSASGPSATTAPKTFQLSCAEFSVRVPADVTGGGPQIEQAVSQEITRRGWAPEASKPGLVIVMGGFSGGESPGDGDGRAKSLLPRLRAATPILQQVEMRTAGARSVRVDGRTTTVGGAGSFLMVVYLLFSGPPLTEDCTR